MSTDPVVVISIIFLIYTGLNLFLKRIRIKQSVSKAGRNPFENISEGISDSFLVVLSLALLGLIFAYVYLNRDVKTSGDAVFWVLGLLVVSMPFSIVFGTLMARKISSGFTNMILGTGGRPDRPRYVKAKNLLVEDRFEEAVEEFRSILKRHPKDTYAQEQIADIYAGNIKNYPQAIEEYNKLLQMNIGRDCIVTTLNRIADIYEEYLNNIPMAVSSINEIVNRFPDTLFAKRAQSRLERMGIHATNVRTHD